MTWKSTSEGRESSSPDIAGIIGNATVAITGRCFRFPPSFKKNFPLKIFVDFHNFKCDQMAPDFTEPRMLREAIIHFKNKSTIYF